MRDISTNQGIGVIASATGNKYVDLYPFQLFILFHSVDIIAAVGNILANKHKVDEVVEVVDINVLDLIHQYYDANKDNIITSCFLETFGLIQQHA